MNLNWKTDFPHIVYKEYFFQKSFKKKAFVFGNVQTFIRPLENIHIQSMDTVKNTVKVSGEITDCI